MGFHSYRDNGSQRGQYLTLFSNAGNTFIVFVYVGEVNLPAMKVWMLGEIGRDKRVLRWLNTVVRVGDLHNTAVPVLKVSNQNHRH
jgi:hypothetical protein